MKGLWGSSSTIRTSCSGVSKPYILQGTPISADNRSDNVNIVYLTRVHLCWDLVYIMRTEDGYSAYEFTSLPLNQRSRKSGKVQDSWRHLIYDRKEYHGFKEVFVITMNMKRSDTVMVHQTSSPDSGYISVVVYRSRISSSMAPAWSTGLMAAYKK